MRRAPSPAQRMVIRSTLPAFPPVRVRTILAGLPPAKGYLVEVKPLRYRTEPHLAGLCDYETHVITLQVPEPFRPFRQQIPYRAQRLKARGARGDPFRFRWFSRNVLFRTKTDVLRFLYCHEFYHYFLHEHLGRKGSAETACDRFALQHFRRRGKVYLRDAQRSAQRLPSQTPLRSAQLRHRRLAPGLLE